jgi:predicted transposase/invertase (TIGR01784 family)
MTEGGLILARGLIGEGLEEGLKKGLEKGLEKGARERAIDIAKKMLAKGEDVSIIIEYTSLSHDDIDEILSDMAVPAV